jgi:hypothetical protein
VLPERFQELPVFVTELNPQHLDVSGGAVGWKPDNADWVHEVARYFRQEQPVTGIVFYRFGLAGDQAPFALENKPLILDAIREEARSDTWGTLVAAGRRPPGVLARIWGRITEAIS